MKLPLVTKIMDGGGQFFSIFTDIFLNFFTIHVFLFMFMGGDPPNPPFTSCFHNAKDVFLFMGGGPPQPPLSQHMSQKKALHTNNGKFVSFNGKIAKSHF